MVKHCLLGNQHMVHICQLDKMEVLIYSQKKIVGKFGLKLTKAHLVIGNQNNGELILVPGKMVQ